MKRIICLLMLTVLLLSSCGETAEMTSKNTAVSKSTEETTISAEETTTTTKEKQRSAPELPDKNYDGAKFTIMSYPKGEAGKWHQFAEFSSSEESEGDLVNDAVKSRNMIIESKYNVLIENSESKDVTADIKKSVLARDNEYDVVLPYIDSAFSLAAQDIILDLYTIPNINLNNEWWDQAMQRDLAIGGKMFIAAGDIIMSPKELLNFVGFNKEMISDYKLENPYTYVMDGTWTIDKMKEMSAKVTNDKDGNGKMDENDVYGAAHDYGISYYMFSSAGGKVATLDENGKPELALNNDRTVNLIEKMSEIYNDPQAMLIISKLPDTWTKSRAMFVNNQVMFLVSSLYVIQTRRAMISDFGVLPLPKYDENQEYYNTPATHVTQCIAVPATNADLECVGIILESLAYESKDTTVKAYYEHNLRTKISRDEESADILDVIFNTMYYDIGLIFGWGNYKSVITKSVQNSGSFMSLYTESESKAIAAIEESYKQFS